MREGKYLIHKFVMESGKQKKRKLEKIEGVIDEHNNIGFKFDNYNSCVITDLFTGLSIGRSTGKTLEECIKNSKNIINRLSNIRESYNYNECKKVFEYLKTCDKPVTERKIRNALGM